MESQGNKSIECLARWAWKSTPRTDPIGNPEWGYVATPELKRQTRHVQYSHKNIGLGSEYDFETFGD